MEGSDADGYAVQFGGPVANAADHYALLLDCEWSMSEQIIGNAGCSLDING